MLVTHGVSLSKLKNHGRGTRHRNPLGRKRNPSCAANEPKHVLRTSSDRCDAQATRKAVNAMTLACITKRLSEAGRRRHPTKLIYPQSSTPLLGSPKTLPRDRSAPVESLEFTATTRERLTARRICAQETYLRYACQLYQDRYCESKDRGTR